MAAPEYAERLAFPAPIRFVLFVVLAGAVAATAYALLTGDGLSATDVAVTAGIVAASVAAVALLRAGVRVRDGELRMALWPYWRARVAVADVAHVETVKVDPMAEAGVLGLRRLSRNTWMLALRRGPGVRITLDDGRTYVLGVDSPEKLRRALRAPARGPR